ncbi:hypothetical protein [Psychroserpens damuponensis]|uniref:hypothetical protein n=1 Tax=Psychroserpens damuponensis TaxID=943936 RepID=UPI00059108DD|nr:hypothetical protein [Psychroserpens damuponensis]
MKLIPSETIEIKSSLSIDQIRELLAHNIEPKMKFKFSKNHKIFEGFIEQDTFEIQRIIRGRNSFKPYIKGDIKSHNNGTLLSASLKMNHFVITFILIWLGMVCFGFFVSIYAVLRQDLNPIAAFGPLIMIVFAYGLMNYGFDSEKKKGIEALETLLKGKANRKS